MLVEHQLEKKKSENKIFANLEIKIANVSNKMQI
jgi:hypothetical protein